MSPPELHELLQPSLGTPPLQRAPYSSQTHFLAAFLGGPLAAFGLGVVNAQRLGRVGRDLPWLLALPVAWLGLRWWMARTPEGASAAEALVALLGGRAVGLMDTALALALFGMISLFHRREDNAASLMGLPRPDGRVAGVIAVVVGWGLKIALTMGLA
jgi:hypothetical protein